MPYLVITLSARAQLPEQIPPAGAAPQARFPARARRAGQQEGASAALTPDPFVVYLYPALWKQLAGGCHLAPHLPSLSKLSPGSPACALPPPGRLLPSHSFS